MSNTDNTDSQPWTSKMTLRLLTNMCTIHTLYTYTTIEVVDIDDDLDFTMYGYGKKVTLIILPLNSTYQHEKWTYEVWEGGPCIGGAKGTCFSTCYSTYDLFQLLSSHEQYYCHILNRCSIWLSVCMIYMPGTTFIYIFSSLSNYSHIRLEAFRYWSSRQHRYILLAAFVTTKKDGYNHPTITKYNSCKKLYSLSAQNLSREW